MPHKIFYFFLLFFLKIDFVFSNEKNLKQTEFIGKFLSIKSDKVNMRTGPDNRYDIKYVYIRRNLPFKILGSFDEWYFVQDPDLETGWIKKNLFFNSKKQSFVFVLEKNGVLCKTSRNSNKKIKIDHFYILRLNYCKDNFCLVNFDNNKLWCEKKDLWGV